MKKSNWSKAEDRLRKSLLKQPTNALARYFLSEFFFHRDNPGYDTDSAYYYITTALSDYADALPRARARMAKLLVDSVLMVRMREQIDSAIFEATRMEGTEEAYIRFLKEHPFAPQRELAIASRNSAAFEKASAVDTYEAYYTFLNKYPDAAEAPLAQRAYDKLLFRAATADGSRSSYEKYLKENPETPYREEVEKNIFRLYTTAGNPSDYERYLLTYPQTRYTPAVRNILFHLIPERDRRDAAFLNDSLRRVVDLEQSYLVPFLENDRYGLMDKAGNVVLPASLAGLDESYLCGNITEDVIVLPDRVIGRTGGVVFRGHVQEIDDIGAGFLNVRDETCLYVVHKSGFVAFRCVDDALTIGNRFLGVKRNNTWTLHGFTGYPLQMDTLQGLRIQENNLWALRDGYWWATSIDRLPVDAGTGDVFTAGPFETATPFPSGKTRVAAEGKEGLINADLTLLIPLDVHRIEQHFFGYVTTSSAGKMIYRKDGNKHGPFRELLIRYPWVWASKDTLWQVFDPVHDRLNERRYHTPWVEGAFAITTAGDTTTVHFSPGRVQHFYGPVQTTFVAGKDSTAFLLVVSGKKKTLWDLRGNIVFDVAHDDIQHAGANLFAVSRKEKKGLLRTDGKLILPVEYDAIGTPQEGMVSTLRSMKFGAYNLSTGQLIRPQYEKNIRRYSKDRLVAYKDGRLGFINWNNKPESEFAFSEVMYWNDSTAWVKKGVTWELYEITTGRPSVSGVKSIRLIRDLPEEKLAIVDSEEGYGVMSSVRGVIVPLAFTDLVNVGSADDPMFFTEKHVAEASVFVVIYYDRDGTFLRRAIYENAEQYEQIYCPDN